MNRRLLLSLVFFFGCGGAGEADPVDGGPGPDASADQPDAPPGTPDGSISAEHFSFFVTSLRALQDLSGSQNRLRRRPALRRDRPRRGPARRRQDLRDHRRAQHARRRRRRGAPSSAPPPAANGNAVNAIDRIGEGPWYDRLGRLLAPPRRPTSHERPANGDAGDRRRFPERGRRPQPPARPARSAEVDNHDTLTGTDAQGKLYNANSTCKDWTPSGMTNGHAPLRPLLAPARRRRPGGGTHEQLDVGADESGCAPGVTSSRTGRPSRLGHRRLRRRLRRLLLLLLAP